MKIFHLFPSLILVTLGLTAAEPMENSTLGNGKAFSFPTSLHDYLDRAQTANPDLQSFAARYEAARARIPQAASLPDPMLQISRFVESVQTRTGPQKNIIGLSQRLPWFGRLSGRERMATAEAEAVHHAFQARQLMLAQAVGLGFFDYAYQGKAIELTAQNLALLGKLVPQVEERVRTGGDLNALLRLQVELGKLRDRLASLTQQRPQLSARLAALLAIPSDELLPWPDWTPEARSELLTLPNPISLLATLDASNPELLLLERKIASASAQTELARLETRPDFTVGLSYIQVGRPVVNPLTPDAGKDPWALTFAVNLPLWNGRTSGVRQEALANKRAAESELTNRRNLLRADAKSALASLQDAHRRVHLYQDDLLLLARQAADITRISYAGNRATLLELIDSERSLLDLDLQLWRAEADAAQQRIILLTLANQPL